MTAVCLALVIGCQLAGTSNVVSPPYPASAIRGGNVVVVLETSKDGSVRRVVVLYGDNPFVEPTRAAQLQWRLPKEADPPVLVVVNFRDPYLKMNGSGKGIVLEPQSRAINAAQYHGSIAVPTFVVDPLYPPSLVAMGAVVLQLTVASSGAVGEVHVVQELGDLTKAAIEAAKKWTFTPARGDANKSVPSRAFAICVYRPLQKPSEPQSKHSI